MWKCSLMSVWQQLILYRKKKQRRERKDEEALVLWERHRKGYWSAKRINSKRERKRKQVSSVMILQGSVLSQLWNKASVCGIFSKKYLIIQPNSPPSCKINLNKDLMQSSEHCGQKIERYGHRAVVYSSGKIPPSFTRLSTACSTKALILLLWIWLWRREIPRDHRSKTGPAACLAGAPVRSSSLEGVTPLAPACSCLPASLALWQMSTMTAGRNNLQLNIPLRSVNVRGGVSLSGKHIRAHAPSHTPSH